MIRQDSYLGLPWTGYCPRTQDTLCLKRPPKNMNKKPFLSNFSSNESSLLCDTIFLNALYLRIVRPYLLPIRYESISPVNTPARAMGIKRKGCVMRDEIRKPQIMSETPSGKGNPRPPKTRITNNPRCGRCSMNETSDIFLDSFSYQATSADEVLPCDNLINFLLQDFIIFKN